jgi:hypothetical protein
MIGQQTKEAFCKDLLLDIFLANNATLFVFLRRSILILKDWPESIPNGIASTT